MINKVHKSGLSADDQRSFPHLERSVRRSPALVYIALAFSDVLAASVSLGLAVILRSLIGPVAFIEAYYQMWPLLLLIIGTFAAVGLYPAIGLGPANELRRLSYAISLVYLFLAGLTFIIRGGWEFSRIIFGLAWVFTLISVPLGRSIIRSIGSKWAQWGIPIVILTNSEKGHDIARFLMSNRKAGFNPVALLTTEEYEEELDIAQGGLELAPQLARSFGLMTAILVFPWFSSAELSEVVDKYCTDYRRLLVIPSFLSGVHIWVTSMDIGGNLGLEILQNLLSPAAQITKRVFDLIASVLLTVVLSPLYILLSIAIFLDSPGPVIYYQERIGRGGKLFQMAKFRTMVLDADAKLEQHLEVDRKLREEWDKFQKLTKDPRLTRVGRWLRRWSLDELPQLFNVLHGEMSLVGPRPMMTGQEEAYGSDFYLYTRVLPGMTGLWQISGRNLTTFGDRARFDTYYVRNWSIWLDFYILAKTPSAVLAGEGVF